MSADPTPTLLRLPEILRRIGVSKATVYRWIREGAFPEPVRLGANAVAWLERDFEAWLTARPVGVRAPVAATAAAPAPA